MTSGGGGTNQRMCFNFISSPRTLLGHVTPSLNVPLLLSLLQRDTAVHVASLWFTNIWGLTERKVSNLREKLQFTSKELCIKKYALMPAKTISEADYTAKRSCLAERPICKGFPSQSMLGACLLWPGHLCCCCLYHRICSRSEKLKETITLKWRHSCLFTCLTFWRRIFFFKF